MRSAGSTEKRVHTFSTDLKATGPSGQYKINCCGPNWPDDQKKNIRASGHIANVKPCLGHTKLMFRITDFSGHFLGGEGGIKIKLTECTKYAESE